MTWIKATTLACCLVLQSCSGSLAGAGLHYGLDYDVSIRGNVANVSLRVTQRDGALKRITLVDFNHQTLTHADGVAAVSDRGTTWQVPSTGGQISWRVVIDHQRQSGSVDAGVGDAWGLFRAEDLIPAIASVSRPKADAVTRLRVSPPKDWRVYTPYRLDDEGWYEVDDDDRRFDRPDGWILIGQASARRDLIADTRVAVAAPQGIGARRQDTLAFLRWHLPALRQVFPQFPDRLLVVMAPDPYFRGGLSAPNSLYLHVERPLISGNGTSTLLHELIHIGFGGRAPAGEDWIVEGIAEYYSARLLQRAGTVSSTRFDETLQDLQRWGDSIDTLIAQSAQGPLKARAAVIFASIDADIAAASNGEKSLDDVVALLAQRDTPVDLTLLRETVSLVLGSSVASLDDAALPGYPLRQ
ncbi:MAG: hypothetical protein AAGA84_10235 [Pseudomonadota bacterium]